MLGISWNDALIDSTMSNVLLALASMALSNNFRYYRPNKEKYSYILFSSVLVAVIWTFITKAINSVIITNVDYVDFLSKSLITRFCIALLIIGCMSLLSWIWYNLEEQKGEESRKAYSEKLAKDAELSQLKQQLQPHFLFNSLNSISALVGTKPEEARYMIQQLSDFLRGTLKKDDEQWTSLKEEMQHLQLYLEIEKIRFGHRLHTQINIGDDAQPLVLPPLLLQPIVENAIKFGLYDTLGEVTITIEAIVENDQLHITIQNPFDLQTSYKQHGTGFGLKSVKRRLYLLFGRNDLLHIETTESIFSTTIKIPQHVA